MRAPRSSARLRALAFVVIVGDVRKRRSRVRGKMSLGCRMLQMLHHVAVDSGGHALFSSVMRNRRGSGLLGVSCLTPKPAIRGCGLHVASRMLHAVRCQMRNESCRPSISLKSSRMVATQHARLNQCSAVSCDHPCAALRARQAFACAADVRPCFLATARLHSAAGTE